ncbi:MAG: TRAP transporter small permease subunit [Gammaproteobacteria bacterium]|jgi:TRAP-type mannitol/chloroaromatic compound transport system permease small subunit
MATPDEHAIAESLPHHTELPHTRFSVIVDRWLRKLGEWLSWIWLVLLGVIVLNVTLRYLFGEGRVEFEEIQWHLYAVGFLLALGYALEQDVHIRVDVLHERFPLRVQAWIELYGIVLLLMPFAALVIIYSLPFIAYSFATNEISPSPGGLPWRYVIKACLLIGFVVLMVAALSRLTRVWSLLFGVPRPTREDESTSDKSA